MKVFISVAVDNVAFVVEVTHNLELPTERTLPSSLSMSAPVQSPVTTSTGLAHALHYGFIIIVCAKPFSHTQCLT